MTNMVGADVHNLGGDFDSFPDESTAKSAPLKIEKAGMLLWGLVWRDWVRWDEMR